MVGNGDGVFGEQVRYLLRLADIESLYALRVVAYWADDEVDRVAVRSNEGVAAEEAARGIIYVGIACEKDRTDAVVVHDFFDAVGAHEDFLAQLGRNELGSFGSHNLMF